MLTNDPDKARRQKAIQNRRSTLRATTAQEKGQGSSSRDKRSNEEESRQLTGTDINFSRLDDEEYCPATDFTGREKKELWKSWKLMTSQDSAGLRRFGVQLSGWVLLNCPEYKRLYDTRSKGSKYKRSYAEARLCNSLVNHVNTLSLELDTLMAKLPDSRSVNKYLQVAGNAHKHAHRTPTTGEAYYREFQTGFKKFVSLQLKGKTSSSSSSSWSSNKDLVLMWGHLIDLMAGPRAVDIERFMVRVSSSTEANRKVSDIFGSVAQGCWPAAIGATVVDTRGLTTTTSPLNVDLKLSNYDFATRRKMILVKAQGTNIDALSCHATSSTETAIRSTLVKTPKEKKKSIIGTLLSGINPSWGDVSSTGQQTVEETADKSSKCGKVKCCTIM